MSGPKELNPSEYFEFGTFQNEITETVINRFYFFGDWEDEYCDLTLDKMVNEVEASKKRNIVRTVNTPEDIEELKKQLAQLVPTNDVFRIDNSKNKGIVKKIRSILSGNKKGTSNMETKQFI